VDRRGLIAPLDGPLIQRRQTLSSTGPNGKNALRSWALNLRNLTPTAYGQLLDLINNSANGCEPIDLTVRGFSLTGATSETVQVRIMNETISVRAESPVRFVVDIELEEFPHAP
jgi:hypothetical protein